MRAGETVGDDIIIAMGEPVWYPVGHFVGLTVETVGDDVELAVPPSRSVVIV